MPVPGAVAFCHIPQLDKEFAGHVLRIFPVLQDLVNDRIDKFHIGKIDFLQSVLITVPDLTNGTFKFLLCQFFLLPAPEQVKLFNIDTFHGALFMVKIYFYGFLF